MSSRGERYWPSRAVPLVGPELLGDVISALSDVAFVVSDMGEVLSVLSDPEPEFGEDLGAWEGRDFRSLLTLDSVGKFDARLLKLTTGQAATPAELNHDGTTGIRFPVRYSFHRLGADGAILLLGRDLSPVAEMQQQLVEAQRALEKDYESHRDARTRMRAVMETSRDAIAFVSQTSGTVTEANGAAARILDMSADELIGWGLGRELTDAGGEAVPLGRLLESAQSDGGGRLRLHTRRGHRPIEVRCTSFRAAGERLLLCRMERAEGALSDRAGLAEKLERFFEKGVEAIVFTDGQGQLTAANDAFLDLLGAESAGALRGRSLADWFARGSVDLKVVTDNAMRNGSMRSYATRLGGDMGPETAVDLSAVYLPDSANPAFAMVIRDVSKSDGQRQTPGIDDGGQSVRELVGSSPLKDIVAETTEVVERMCIQTAVELTGNNRVAAAEMLGLSRQSLYVKLRKYGLLARNGD